MRSRVELLALVTVVAVFGAFLVSMIRKQQAQVADVVARASLREAVPAVEGYFADHGTYAGMTAAYLLAHGSDADASLELGRVTASGYCLEATYDERTWRQNGPGAPVERGSC